MNGYKLSNSIPFLLNRIGVRLGECFGSELAAHGLTLQMYRVLAALRENDGLTLRELGKRLSTEQSTLSRIIGQMCEMGIVDRRRETGDARTVCISLTEEGRQAVECLVPRARHWEAVLMAPLQDEQVNRLRETLKSIDRVIDDISPDPAALQTISDRFGLGGKRRIISQKRSSRFSARK